MDHTSGWLAGRNADGRFGHGDLLPVREGVFWSTCNPRGTGGSLTRRLTDVIFGMSDALPGNIFLSCVTTFSMAPATMAPNASIHIQKASVVSGDNGTQRWKSESCTEVPPTLNPEPLTLKP